MAIAHNMSIFVIEYMNETVITIVLQQFRLLRYCNSMYFRTLIRTQCKKLAKIDIRIDQKVKFNTTI